VCNSDEWILFYYGIELKESDGDTYIYMVVVKFEGKLGPKSLNFSNCSFVCTHADALMDLLLLILNLYKFKFAPFHYL
jgi:hypothetical protein